VGLLTSASQVGQVNNLIIKRRTSETDEVFNGVDLTLNARFGRAGVVSGGMSTGRSVTNACFVVNSPQNFGSVITPPWSAATQVKLFAVYPLPLEFRVSANTRTFRGSHHREHGGANTVIAPSLWTQSGGRCRRTRGCSYCTRYSLRRSFEPARRSRSQDRAPGTGTRARDVRRLQCAHASTVLATNRDTSCVAIP